MSSAGPEGSWHPDKGSKKESKIRQRSSCAECRRLKIKCSRVWPCESCVKGGCAQICPDGQLWKTSGKRILLGDREDLIRLVARKRDGRLPSPRPSTSTTLPKSDAGYVMESSLGTLTHRKQKTSRYVGKFAGSEYLGETGRTNTPDGVTIVSHPGVEGDGSDVTIKGLQGRLPIWETEGRGLVDLYWRHVDWVQRAIPRPQFDHDILINAYDQTITPEADKLACVFLVMALGVLYDLGREPYQARGNELFEIGQTCLRSSMKGEPSLATVQAILLSGTFILNDHRNDGAEAFWPLLGNAIKIAQSIGLHRDGNQFGLPPHEVQARRQVWWELLTYDRLQALCFGRPCASANRHSDTDFPHVDEWYFCDPVGYHASKHRLAHMVERVIDLQNQVAPLSYSSIIELDDELVKFKATLAPAIESNMDIENLPLHSNISTHTVLQRFGIRLLIAQTRLHLNRPAFNRAISTSPFTPHQSQFGASFLALHNSAQEIVHIVKQLVLYHPSLVARWWAAFFHAFTAASCLAVIAIHAPKSMFSRDALVGLSIMCDLSAAARDGYRARKGLTTLLKMRDKARLAISGSAEGGIDAPYEEARPAAVSNTRVLEGPANVSSILPVPAAHRERVVPADWAWDLLEGDDTFGFDLRDLVNDYGDFNVFLDATGQPM